MIRYTIPGMTEFPDLCLLFCSLWRKQPDMFFPDVAIESVYGGFPGSQLGGGRNNVGPFSGSCELPAQRTCLRMAVQAQRRGGCRRQRG